MKDKKEGERLLFGKRKPKLPAAEDCEPKLPVLQPDIQKYIPSTPGLLATSISLIGGRKTSRTRWTTGSFPAASSPPPCATAWAG